MLGNSSCFLSSVDFFQNLLFRKILSGIPSSIANSLDPDHAQCTVGLIWVQTVSKDQQQTTKFATYSQIVNGPTSVISVPPNRNSEKQSQIYTNDIQLK